MQSQDIENNAQAIVDASDLVSLIEEFGVSLKRQGRERVGLCPFHEEKTPSFSVNPAKQVYLCRGCGATGNVVTFAAGIRGTENDIAMEWLAERAGIEYIRGSRGNHNRKQAKEKPIYEVLQAVASAFQNFLTEDPSARDYLSDRGITDQQTTDYLLGYAPMTYDLVPFVVSASGLKESEITDVLHECGLLKSSGRMAFIDRLIFPITNHKGQICGFAGRALSEASGPGKYINSPESTVFHKRDTLYGLTPPANISLESRKRWHAIQQEPIIYVVEGYTDVLALNRHGIQATAAMGTAFTDAHFRSLTRRGHKHIRLCFDGDRAGQSAASKTTDELISLIQDDHLISFVQLSKNEDPDTMITQQGRDAFMAASSISLGENWLQRHALGVTPDVSPESTVRAHSALDILAPTMASRLLASELRHFVSRHVGPHPLEHRTYPAPDANSIHPLILRILFHILEDPMLMYQFELPDACWVVERLSGQERSLTGLNLILKARTLAEPETLSDRWALADHLLSNGYPASWLRAILDAGKKKAPSFERSDDAKASWKICLRFAEIHQTVGVLWPLSK